MPRGVTGYLTEVVLWIDQSFNVLTGGYADETFSARCFRQRHKSDVHAFAYKVVNAIFFWQVDHCHQAFLNEKNRKGLPYEYREGDR